MLSKVTVDVSDYGQEQILIKFIASDDLRDRLVGRLVHKFTFGYGFARFSILSNKEDGTLTATLVPIEPWKLDEHQSEWDALQSPYRKENADPAPEQKPIGANPDDWAQENLSPDLYRKWRKDVFGQEYKLKSELSS